MFPLPLLISDNIIFYLSFYGDIQRGISLIAIGIGNKGSLLEAQTAQQTLQFPGKVYVDKLGDVYNGNNHDHMKHINSCI